MVSSHSKVIASGASGTITYWAYFMYQRQNSGVRLPSTFSSVEMARRRSHAHPESGYDAHQDADAPLFPPLTLTVKGGFVLR
jgi:hypothetical protein